MSQYGEPWSVGKGICSDMIYRSDGAAIAKAANRLKAEEYDLCNARVASCVNALNGKNPDALARFVFQAKMALEVLESGPENLRVSARALRKAMEYFGT